MPLLQWGRPRPAQVVHAAPQRGGLCAALAEVERRHVTRVWSGKLSGWQWATDPRRLDGADLRSTLDVCSRGPAAFLGVHLCRCFTFRCLQGLAG
eukprot:scaffold8140_cov68-Phaeocystis_antarctica.AAC.1